jgi:hypothetical protein
VLVLLESSSGEEQTILYSAARCMCSAFAPAQCGNSVANDKRFRDRGTSRRNEWKLRNSAVRWAEDQQYWVKPLQRWVKDAISMSNLPVQTDIHHQRTGDHGHITAPASAQRGASLVERT